MSARGITPAFLGIMKRGNTYRRTLLIHGARAAMPSLSASLDSVPMLASTAQHNR